MDGGGDGRRAHAARDYSFPPPDLDPVGAVRKAGFSAVERARIRDDNARASNNIPLGLRDHIYLWDNHDCNVSLESLTIADSAEGG
jgi:hypothetical protein